MQHVHDKYIEIGGRKWWRQKANLSHLKIAKVDEIPDPLIHHVKQEAKKKKDDPSYFFMDGVNPDLVYVSFVLDSEGYNGNWDFLPRSRLMASYHTARYKPFDCNHVIKEESTSMLSFRKDDKPQFKNTIYGVMTHAALADADGNILSEKELKKIDASDDIDRDSGEKLTVVAWAALYNFLFPQTVVELVEAVENGNMKVSMERWCSEYDFMYCKDSKWLTCTREEGEKNGMHTAWEKRLGYLGQPVYRRCLSHVYGGVASTNNPANALSRFLDQSSAMPVKQAASLADDPILKNLLSEHEAIHERFNVASDAEKPMLIESHDRIHRAVEAYIGGE